MALTRVAEKNMSMTLNKSHTCMTIKLITETVNHLVYLKLYWPAISVLSIKQKCNHEG